MQHIQFAQFSATYFATHILEGALGSKTSLLMATGHRKSTESPGRSVSNPKIRNIHSMGVSLALSLIQHLCPGMKFDYGDQD